MRLDRAARCLGIVGLLAACSLPAGASERSSLPILLVHGVAWELGVDDCTWGGLKTDDQGEQKWNGMVEFLEDQGLRFGGVIVPKRGQVRLPDNLDTRGARVEPRKADVFMLRFSPSANTDGLGYKALELAETIKQVRQLTGAKKVRIVGHSAGGLVARVYLQSALPGVKYRGDVDRLITIATPHLGSAMALRWGDYLGTRATSIKPDAALIRELNCELDLPTDVTFASIVIRGIAADARGLGKELDALVDHKFLARLPVEYRIGGDEVVHVRSQNLRLAECAARYERATGRPIQYILARVPDPSPKDRSFWDVRVHVAGPMNGMVQHLVSGMLQDKAVLWKKTNPTKLAGWLDWQARLYANGVIEEQTIGEHPLSEVRNVRIEDFALVENGGNRRRYSFTGKAFSANMVVSLRRRWTHVDGTMALTFDDFGRVLTAEAEVR